MAGCDKADATHIVTSECVLTLIWIGANFTFCAVIAPSCMEIKWGDITHYRLAAFIFHHLIDTKTAFKCLELSSLEKSPVHKALTPSENSKVTVWAAPIAFNRFYSICLYWRNEQTTKNKLSGYAEELAWIGKISQFPSTISCAIYIVQKSCHMHLVVYIHTYLHKCMSGISLLILPPSFDTLMIIVTI